jgi:hypothetical protein
MRLIGRVRLEQTDPKRIGSKGKVEKRLCRGKVQGPSATRLGVTVLAHTHYGITTLARP